MLQTRPSTMTLPVWITFGAILTCLLAWYDVPLFYDEVAFRMQQGRAFVDGFVKRSLFPQCSALGATPWFLLPAHVIYSWIDGWPSWMGVRTIPILALVSLLAATSWALVHQCQQNRTYWAFMLLCGGFVGISGLSMVLSRHEYIMLLHVACVLGTWQLGRKPPLPLRIVGPVIAVHLLVISLSLLAHLQGILLMPLSFITCMQLLRNRRVPAVVVAVFMVLMTSNSVFNGFSCPDDPVLEQAVKKAQGSGIAANETGSWAEKMGKRMVRFERQFFFRAQPEAFTLPIPAIPQRAVRLLNAPVAAVVTLNLAALLMATALVASALSKKYRRGKLRTHLNALFCDGQFLWFLAAILLIAYSIYEISGTFYRAYFRNLLTVVLIAIAATHIHTPRGNKLLKLAGIFVCATCFASSLVVWSLIAPPLKQGYAGVGVSLQRDWPAFNAGIANLAQRCGITPDMTRVIMDDTTYAALRNYREPIGYNYIWGEEILILGSIQKKAPAERLERIRSLGSPGYVVRCDALELFGLPADQREGEVCCHLMHN